MIICALSDVFEILAKYIDVLFVAFQVLTRFSPWTDCIAKDAHIRCC